MTLLLLLLNDGWILRPYLVFHSWAVDQTILSRITFIALSGLIGIVLGWFWSGRNPFLRAIIMGPILGTFGFVLLIDQGVLGWSTASITSLIAFCAGLGYWARVMVDRFMEPPNIFGNSEWASDTELQNAELFEPSGIRLGYRAFADNDLPIYYGGDRHLGTFAPNRSMKGTSAIIPNLLTFPGSVVVLDPKGENAMITAEHRRSMGQEVHVVDPYGITGLESASYNPLDEINGGDVDIPDDLMVLTEGMIMASGSEPFWTDEAKALNHGLSGYVATHPDERNARTLARVRDLSLMNEENLQVLFGKMLDSPHHFVASAGARGLQKDKKLLSNVMATLQSQTHFLDSPRLRDSLSQSDFSFADLKTKPMTVYLVLPSDKLDSHGRWMRLMVQQALSLNARNIDFRPDHPVLFVLDELPALGRLPMVEKAFGLMAGYGIKLWAIAQDLNQLKRVYGDGWETFISNAGAIQYFGSRDKFTAEYFSSLCGVKTVWSLSYAVGRTLGHSSSTGVQGGSESQSNSSSASHSFSTAQQNLAYPDQLMRLDKGKQLLFVENMNPIIADKVAWFDDEKLRDKGVNLHRQQGRVAG